MKWRTGLLSRSGDSPREIKYGKESQLGQFIHPSPPLGSVTHILPLSIMLMPQNPPPPSISSQPPLCRSSCNNFLDIGRLFPAHHVAKPPSGGTDQTLPHARHVVSQNRLDSRLPALAALD